MRRPPPYVAALFPDHLRVSYARQKLRDTIRHAGYDCSRDAHGFNVRYPQGAPRPEDRSFVELMRFLNGLALPFGEDYKSPMAPADCMRLLQKKGLLTEPFQRIGWWVPPDGFLIEEVAPRPAGGKEDES